MRRILVAFLLAILAVCFSTQQSQAAYSYPFNQSNEFGSGPFGTVTIKDSTDGLASGTVEISFNITQTDAKIWDFAFNTKLDPTTLVGKIGIPTGSSWTVTNPFDKNMNGFGKFELLVGGKNQHDGITSGTIKISGLSAADAVASNFIEFSTKKKPSDPDYDPDPDFAYFAAHMWEPDGDKGKTGYIATNGNETNMVPAPPGILLAGSGAVVFGLGGLVRRLRRKA